MSSDDEQYEQTDAEIDAQVEGVATFGLGWLTAILTEFRWDLAMQTATPELRRGHAEGWVLGALQTGEISLGERDEVLTALSAPDVDHRWWDRFALANHRYYTRRFGDVRDNLAVGSRPRPIDVDHELVGIVDYRTVEQHGVEGRGGRGVFLTEAVPPFVWLTLRHYPEGFLVAGIDFIEDHPQPPK